MSELVTAIVVNEILFQILDIKLKLIPAEY